MVNFFRLLVHFKLEKVTTINFTGPHQNQQRRFSWRPRINKNAVELPASNVRFYAVMTKQSKCAKLPNVLLTASPTLWIKSPRRQMLVTNVSDESEQNTCTNQFFLKEQRTLIVVKETSANLFLLAEEDKTYLCSNEPYWFMQLCRVQGVQELFSSRQAPSWRHSEERTC